MRAAGRPSSSPARGASAVAAAVPVLAAVLLWPGSAGAIPPDGIVDEPGTPPGTLEVTNTAGLRDGKVQFCVRNFVTTDRAAPQMFMVKFDNFGSAGIGPFQPDASGTYCGEVATDPSAYATKKSSDDKIPAGLCSTGGAHSIRVLSGTWAHPNAVSRSVGSAITVDGTCGTGGKASAPTTGVVIGTDAGVAAPSGGGSGTGPAGSGSGAGTGTNAGAGAGTGTGGPTGNPGAGSSGAGGAASLAGLFRLRSSILTVGRTAATLKVRRTAAVGRGTITVRSTQRLALGGRGAKRIRTLVAARPYSLSAAVQQTLQVRLTATARRVLRGRTRLSARITTTPAGGVATTSTVVLRVPKTTK